MATAKQLDDILECSICTEMYTDPRVLPCVHTYCLQCIKAWCKDSQPGDKLACPLCRKEFSLPNNGVEDLPKNFYVINFLEMKELQMKELSSVESMTSPCEACSGDEESVAEKSTRSRKLIEIGDDINADELGQSVPPATCDEHTDENLKLKKTFEHLTLQSTGYTSIVIASQHCNDMLSVILFNCLRIDVSVCNMVMSC